MSVCKYCTSPRSACPLPRIGSKEWGWTRTSEISALGNEWFKYVSALASNYTISERGWCTLFDLSEMGSSKRTGSDLSLRDAKTLAESRARRDWRRENGKKK